MQLNGIAVDVYPLIELVFKHTASKADFAHKAQVLNDSGKAWNK